MNGRKLTRLNFLLEYNEDTIASHPIETPKSAQSRSTRFNVLRLSGKHFPDYISGSSATNNPSRKCALYYTKKKD